MTRILMILILVIGCAGESTDNPGPKPVAIQCDNGGLLDTPDGRRLLVECNQDVPNPPATCVRETEGDYLCNIYHTSESDCEAFPGLCKTVQ